MERRITQKLRNSNTEIGVSPKQVEAVRLVNPELVNHLLQTKSTDIYSLPDEIKVRAYIIC